MLKRLRKFIPHELVNYGKHLPTAVLANLKYGYPSRGLKIIGVTGTDGKTTTVNMIYQILKDQGLKVSMISTIKAVIGDKNYDTGFHVTNPTHFDLQRYIKQAKSAGSEYLVLEVTSQGLAQFRTWGINFDIGVITNITPEHLDYHKTFDKYLLAKAKLIKHSKWAVLNKDDKNFDRLKTLVKKGRVISYAISGQADINSKGLGINLKLPGDYNISNALAALAVGQILNLNLAAAVTALNNFENLEGRMEEIKNKKGIKIIIDFAHTPNALENALKTLRKSTTGRLISVFGAASERDENKRPLMGKISATLADITVLTDEDPRFENSLKIINEIAGDFYGEQNLFKEPDRAKAIDLAISLAKPGDTVGIFGKGHEKSMNYRGVEKPWSDKQAVLKDLNER